MEVGGPRRAHDRQTMDMGATHVGADWSIRVGKPKGRWENALIDFFAGRTEERSWLTIAKDREVWRSLEREFVNE